MSSSDSLAKFSCEINVMLT